MSEYFWCSLIGLFSGIIGSIILAFSLSSFIEMISTTTKALQLSIISISQVLTNRSFDAYVFKGFEKHLENLSSKSKNRTLLGIIFLLLGFIFQAIGLIISVIISTNHK